MIDKTPHKSILKYQFKRKISMSLQTVYTAKGLSIIDRRVIKSINKKYKRQQRKLQKRVKYV